MFKGPWLQFSHYSNLSGSNNKIITGQVEHLCSHVNMLNNGLHEESVNIVACGHSRQTDNGEGKAERGRKSQATGKLMSLCVCVRAGVGSQRKR